METAMKFPEITYNTWVDCELPWQLCVGSDAERTDIPSNVLIAQNIVYSPDEPVLIKAFDKISGIRFENNLNYSNQGNEVGEVFLQGEVKLGHGPAGLPLALTKVIIFSKQNYVNTNIDGRPRATEKTIGAFEMAGGQATVVQASKKNSGPVWGYMPLQTAALLKNDPKTYQITTGENTLYNAIKKSQPGDIIELAEGEYVNTKKMVINYPLTIRAIAGIQNRPVIKMNSETPTVVMFELRGASGLHLQGVALDGTSGAKNPGKYAFVTGKEDMSDSYNLFIDNCDIYDFNETNGGCIFKAYKTSFADTLKITNSILRNSYRGIALNDEKDDKGIYNAEYTIFENTVFKNIGQWTLDFYRGGNDESTLGGFLIIDHCIFDDVYSKENQTMLRRLISTLPIPFSVIHWLKTRSN